MKTIAIDFDGVIHSYENGWQDGSIYGNLIPHTEAAFETIIDEGYNICIMSSRDRRQILEWMQVKMPNFKYELVEGVFHNGKEIGISNAKVAAAAYIDDRALKFRNWDQAIHEIKNLVPNIGWRTSKRYLIVSSFEDGQLTVECHEANSRMEALLKAEVLEETSDNTAEALNRLVYDTATVVRCFWIDYPGTIGTTYLHDGKEYTDDDNIPAGAYEL